MRRALHLLWILTLATFAAPPVAHATSVTVQLSGEWFQVTDNGGVTDGSIDVGGSFTVTLTFDDATPDGDASAATGFYLLPGASTDLTLSTGNYSFTLLASESVELVIDNNVSSQDALILFAENFVTTGPLPGGVATGYGYTNPFIVDSTETAHSSDDLTDLPWSASVYDSPNNGMYFLIAVNGAGPNKFIELMGDFTSFTVLPEPTGLLLLGMAVAIAIRARRG
jgi:hypothetical protein